MSILLLPTKLHIPISQRSVVVRQGLIEKITSSMQAKLILLSAPAGYGKTTLVSEAIQMVKKTEALRIAWLSLDLDDNDPIQFFAYLDEATKGIPRQQNSLAEMLQSQQASPKALAKSFLNDLISIQEPFLLVLDDYHVIDSQEIDEVMAFLIDKMPQSMTLMMTSRSDPSFPLARLRARGELVEIRADDLRFSNDEAAQFMQEVMDISISDEQISVLGKRTEGWVAGLQMAALSMRDRSLGEIDRFVQKFTGSHRYIVDYLLDEVLLNQPAHIRSFLLQTSILRRLCGPLCDAVTGQEDSGKLLQTLEQDNLFVIPLDDERRWYRYHHLFLEVLQAQAHRNESLPDDLALIHQRASKWYEQNNTPKEAVYHALLAEDFERVAYLAEFMWRAMNVRYQSPTWLGWVKKIPENYVQASPVLSVGYAWALLDAGEMEAAELRLQDAERWLSKIKNTDERPSGMVVVDETEFKTLLRTLANARAYLAQAMKKLSDAIRYAQEALDLLVGDDYFERGLAYLILGFAHWSNGDLDTAYQAVSDAVVNMRRAENLPFTISFTSYLADILAAQGLLNEAVQKYSRLLNAILDSGEPVIPEVAVLHLGLSELYIEQGDLETAKSHFMQAEALGEQPAFPPWHRHWSLAQAGIKSTEHDLDGAIDILTNAERLSYRHPFPNVRPISAMKIRTKLAQGRLDAAWEWVEEQGFSVNASLSYMREFEHITFARVLVAQYKNDHDQNKAENAKKLLHRLLEKAEQGKRVGSVIEVLNQLALFHIAKSDNSSALKFLKRALQLAEHQKYVRIFVDEGKPMALLLQEALSENFSTAYIKKLLDTFSEDDTDNASSEYLDDLLTEREREILVLISAGLKNKEIAEQVVVSVNTVLYHTKNIYNKLGVNKRTQAVLKAKELGFLQ